MASAPGTWKAAAVTEQPGSEDTTDETTVVQALEHAATASLRSILVGSGPRFARDAFGPVLAFYIGWEFVGLWAGMALAVGVSAFAYLYERRRERPGCSPASLSPSSPYRWPWERSLMRQRDF